MRSSTVRGVFGLPLALLLGLAACGGGSAEEEAGTATPPLTGLSATIFQTRTDVGVRQLQVRVHNETGRDLLLTSVRLDSSGFDAPMTYDRRENLLHDGRRVALPVAVSTAVCPAAEARHTVHVNYELDGVAGSAEVAALDEGGRVGDLQEAECFIADVERTAEMSITDLPTVRTMGEDLVADVVVRLTPGTGDGQLTIGQVGATTLLQQVDPVSGERLPQGSPVDLVVPAAPSTFSFTVIPGRCDAHAVAEDKQGTLFPVQVTLDDRNGLVRVGATSEVTVALYEFVSAACAHGR